NLPWCDDQEAHNSPLPRQKQHPDQSQFERERGIGGGGVKPVRQVLYIPADPGRQRTILIILVHGGHTTPFWISARDLRDTGLEVDAKPFPLQKEDTCAHRGLGSA